MTPINKSVKDDLSTARIREKRASRSALGFTIVSLAVGVLWIFYSFNQVSDLQATSSRLAKQNDNLSQELVIKRDELKKATEALLAINPILEKFGVTKERVTAENLNTNLVKQSLEANREIQKNTSNEPEKRRSVTVQYYLKDVDAKKVEEALRDYGFRLEISKPGRPDLPTNLIAFGDQVNPDDAKLVAYVLVRAGVDIKALCKTSINSKASVIQVLGNEPLLTKQALSVEQIRNQKDFQLCSSTGQPWSDNR